ncbi:hypothetical protein Gotri_018866 [Gossypium trilobum]|uniref:Uncharacterized protein n=1 Tax=Gossypium trilobum TaxID=34281 RepID=A0A7J9EBD4_9ROSI|nr:hypothetical protein [Gossypium trilobum]
MRQKKITSFIYNHTWTVDYMKKYTKGAELLRPGMTRFATNVIASDPQILKTRVVKWCMDKFHRLSRLTRNSFQRSC